MDYKTAYRWFRNGILPIPSTQIKSTGTILVHPSVPGSDSGVALYARVSSADQKQDLDRQIARLSKFAAEQGMRVVESVVESITEIGSALNGRRSKFIRLLKNPKIGIIVSEHRDRLARFGSEYIEAALAASGRRLIIVDSSEMKDDLVGDMIDVLTLFCARLYGRRSAKNKAKKALEAIEGKK
ncbi:MAG: IS607 family transposase [Nitrospirae bacterium]|nr:IS607 family transposase [Nitrospirota bacterium]